MIHVTDNPCNGKDCKNCESCIYDEEIPVYKPPKKDNVPIMNYSLCNYCGYLIKTYKDHGDVKYNACCGKHLIQAGEISRPRTISFNIQDPIDIPIPDWCPKLSDSFSEAQTRKTEETHRPQSSEEAYLTYKNKRDRMRKLPRHVEWEDIKEGKFYVLPTIIDQKRKVIKVLGKTEYTIRCSIVEENGQETSYIHNVYKSDLDTVFIVEYHKF